MGGQASSGEALLCTHNAELFVLSTGHTDFQGVLKPLHYEKKEEGIKVVLWHS